MGSFMLNLAGLEVWWPGLILLGLCIGFLTGMFGVGGGFLLTPFLNIFFQIPYPVAVGSGLTQIFLTGGASTWKHWRKGNVDLKLGSVMAVGAFLGTELGVRMLKKLSLGSSVVVNGRILASQDLILSGLFVVLMCGIAFHILKETASDSGNEVVAVKPKIAIRLQKVKLPPRIAFVKSDISGLCLWIPLCLSFGVGILTGMMGVGGGFIAFPLLVYVLGAPTMMAIGTSAFQILFASAYGALRHAGQGHVELWLVAFMLIGSLLGVQFGVYATKFLGGQKLRRYFAYVIGLGVVVIVWDFIRKIGL